MYIWLEVLMGLFLALFLLAQDPPPLGEVSLKPDALGLLEDRLTIRMPEGTASEPRGHNLMGAPQPKARETRLVWTSGDRKIVVMANELFRTAGKELEAMVRREIGSWHLEADVSGARDQDSLRVCVLTPRKLDPSTEAVFIQGLFVLRPDSTVLYVAFYANPKAAADAKGCSALALKAGASIRAGRRELAREAGPRVLMTLEGGRNCVVDVPEGYSMTFQNGIDFFIATVSKVIPLGDPGSSFNVYFGWHPGYHFDREEKKPSLVSVPGKLLGQEVEWKRWTDSTDSRRPVQEVIVAIPGTERMVAHVFLQAADAAGLKELEAMAGKLRIEASK